MNLSQFRQIRKLSQQALERLKHIPSTNLVWKANENDPLKHSSFHEGLFYELPQNQEEIIKIFADKSPYQTKTADYYRNLGILPIMIRKPALTAIDYINRTQTSTPNLRILFYGDIGCGKSHTLAHLIHYIRMTGNFFMVYFKDTRRHVTSPRGWEESVTRPGRIDTPVDASLLLQRFRIQNELLLQKHEKDLVCTSTYKWSVRESTEAGEPLMKVVEHGINRINHASDCFAVLLKELSLAADVGKIRLVTVMDNIRFLFRDQASVIKHNNNKYIMVDEMTIPRAAKKIIKSNLRNSIVLATCDDESSGKQNQTPREVLGLEGWSHFDPCLPIHVPKYSRQEFESCMNLYQDIGWLGRPESCTQEGRDEVRFLSGLNPQEVANLCQSL